MEKNKKLVGAIILLIVIVAGVSFLAVNEYRKNKEMAEVFAVEKQEMENEYSAFATQYDELQVQINNDSLREKLESEKLKTQRLLEELRQVKTTNAAEILRLKKELKTVRAVLCTDGRKSGSEKQILSCHSANQYPLARKEKPERKGIASSPTGCHQHLCTTDE